MSPTVITTIMAGIAFALLFSEAMAESRNSFTFQDAEFLPNEQPHHRAILAKILSFRLVGEFWGEARSAQEFCIGHRFKKNGFSSSFHDSFMTVRHSDDDGFLLYAASRLLNQILARARAKTY